jgi:glutaredoxin
MLASPLSSLSLTLVMVSSLVKTRAACSLIRFVIVTRDGETASGDDVQNVLKTKYSHRTVPAVFVKGALKNGCFSLQYLRIYL